MDLGQMLKFIKDKNQEQEKKRMRLYTLGFIYKKVNSIDLLKYIQENYNQDAFMEDIIDKKLNNPKTRNGYGPDTWENWKGKRISFYDNEEKTLKYLNVFYDYLNGQIGTELYLEYNQKTEKSIDMMQDILRQFDGGIMKDVVKMGGITIDVPKETQGFYLVGAKKDIQKEKSQENIVENKDTKKESLDVQIKKMKTLHVSKRQNEHKKTHNQVREDGQER